MLRSAIRSFFVLTCSAWFVANLPSQAGDGAGSDLDPPRVPGFHGWHLGRPGGPPEVDVAGLRVSCAKLETGALAALAPYDKVVDLHLDLTATVGAKECPADFLAPVAKLRALEAFTLVVPPRLGSDALRALRDAPKLRFLQLTMLRPLTIADVTTLQELPGLVGLKIVGSVLGEGGSIDRSAMRALGLLPRLGSLTLGNLAGCTEPVLCELRNLKSLRRLELFRLGEQPVAVRLGRMPEVAPVDAGAEAVGARGAGGDSDALRSAQRLVRNERERRIQAASGLSPAVADALAELPQLAELRLWICAVSGAAVGRLPTTLTAVSIVACPDADASVYEALGRLEGLRRLEFGRTSSTRSRGPFVGVVTGANEDEPGLGLPDQRAVDRAQADLLERLPIETFTHHWPMLPELAAALAGASELRSVELSSVERGDLEAVARVPGLRELTITSHQLEPEQFEPLRAAKGLGVLRLSAAQFDLSKLRALLPGVEIETGLRDR